MAPIVQNRPERPLEFLPEYLAKYQDKVTNFGLYFQKFGRYHQDGDVLKTQHSWSNGKKGRDRRDYEWSLVHNHFTASQCMKIASTLLSTIHEHQNGCLEGMQEQGRGIMVLKARAVTRFLTGIGQTTPTEVGMVFDRNSGLPFLPAASVKGAVRYAYCINYAREHPEIIQGTNPDNMEVDEKQVPGLEDIFGSTDTRDARRGGFVFMNIYALEVPDLVMDIMNPHHGAYYRREHPETGPVETESPVPIKFLSVEKGFTFVFRGFFLTPEALKHVDRLEAAFETALIELGLGAKTAVGYGRFDEIKNETAVFLDAAKKRRDKRLDMEKREQKQLLEAEQKAREAEEKKQKAAEKAEKKAKEKELKVREKAAYQEALAAAEGIDRAILELEKGDEQMAIDMYDKYLVHIDAKKDILDEKQQYLANLVKKKFKKMKKNAKKSKLKRKRHVDALIRTCKT